MSVVDAQNTKKVLLVPPQLKNDGDLAGNTYVDTAGWGYLEILLITGTTDIALGSTAEATEPVIEECDTTGGSYTEISGAVLSAVIADDDDDTIKQIDVNLADKTHKRYMRIKAPRAGDGTNGVNFCAIAILSKPQTGPTSATERGLDEHVIA